jgi:Protein of unknown function (DUF3108)
VNVSSARCALAVLGFAWMACAQAQGLAPFTASYEIRHGAMRVGETRFVLSEDDSHRYVFESRTQPKGFAKMFVGAIVETSEFRVDGERLRPLRFSAEESRGKGSQTIDFDWAAGIAHAQRYDERADLTLRPRVLDHSLVQVALMRDLADGRPLATYYIVEKNDLRAYQYERAGEEQVDTPAGAYATVKVRQSRPGSSRELYFWCAPALAYLPVRLEQRKEGKAVLTMSLTSAEGLGVASGPNAQP